MRSIIVGFGFLAVAIAALPLQAQILEGQSQGGGRGAAIRTGGAYYDFGSETGLNFDVSIWGFVNNPGRYRIPSNMNLLDLFSYAGGFREGAFLDRIKIIRRPLDDDNQTMVKKVFEVNLEQYLELSDTEKSMAELKLYPNDIILVQGETPKPTIDWILRLLQTLVAISSLMTATIVVVNALK